MNSSINSPEPSNPTTNSEQTSPPAASTIADEASWHRQQPIPPPSEPMQYRAIGLVRGLYSATSAEQFTQGTLLTADNTHIDAVLLGRIISLLKNHLDLAQEHLWVVYPRTGQKEDSLHLQIVGVWEPEKLAKLTATEQAVTSPEPETTTSQEVVDGYFSVRGEIVYQSVAEGHFIVKIRQTPRSEADKPKYFKLKIQGDLAAKAVGQFWDLQVQRQAEDLVLVKGESIAALPSKPKLRKKPRSNDYGDRKRNFEPPQLVRRANLAPIEQPIKRSPPPKPIKRQKPSS